MLARMLPRSLLSWNALPDVFAIALCIIAACSVLTVGVVATMRAQSAQNAPQACEPGAVQLRALPGGRNETRACLKQAPAGVPEWVPLHLSPPRP